MAEKRSLIVVAVLLISWGLLALATYNFRQPTDDYVYDFFPRWYGARQVLLEGNSEPYSVEIEKTIQDYMEFEAHEPHRHNFLYPAPIIYLLIPFWLLPWELSISLWAALALLLIIVMPLTMYLILGWRVRPILLALVVFTSLFPFRFSLVVYFWGQFLAFILASLMLSWWATVHRKQALSGVALIFATLRPDGAILAGAMLFDLLLKRRFKTLLVWGGIMGTLLLLSFIQLGWWVDDMLVPVRGYKLCCDYTYPPAELPGGRGVELLFSGAVAVWAGWMLLQMRQLPDLTRIPWSLSTVIVAYLLLFEQSKDYTLVYMLFPLWFTVWAAQGHWLTSLLVLAILASPWLYVSLGMTLRHYNPKEQLLSPLFTGILLTIHWLRWSKLQLHARLNADPGASEVSAVA